MTTTRIISRILRPFFSLRDLLFWAVGLDVDGSLAPAPAGTCRWRREDMVALSLFRSVKLALV